MLRKMTALRLFLVALCCVVFLGEPSLTETQATVSPVFPQPPTPRNVRGVIKGGESRHGAPGISLAGGEPIFRPTNMLPRVEDYVFEDVTQKLDGLDCTNCTFKDVTLEYEGGIFNLTNATFSGRTRLILKGAAANAFSAGSMFAAIGSGGGSASAPDRPVIKATMVRQPVKLDWKSPYESASDASTKVGTQR